MDSDALEITKTRIFKIWWCLLWRTYLGCLVVFLAIWGIEIAIKYFVFTLMGELSSETIELIETPFNALGTLLLIYISFVVVRFIFKKKFSDFEIVLVARSKQKPNYEQNQQVNRCDNAENKTLYVSG
jgi:hypothetical protein